MYYHKVFNISQLVVYIFQYLDDLKHLIHCSMVDSVWLINSFHANCTKYLTLPFRPADEITKTT